VAQSTTHLLGGDKAPLCITGTGLISAAGRGIHRLAESLLEKRSHLGRLERIRGVNPTDSGGEIPNASLGVPAEDTEGGKRALALARAALEEALGAATGRGKEISREKVGLAVGSALGPVEEVEAWIASEAPLTPARLREMSFESFVERLAETAPPRGEGLGGPRSAFSVTCASGLCALEQAAADLAFGRADAMAVGALDTLSCVMQAGFSSLQALSPTGRLRPFDVEHDGIVLGEAAAFVVIESLRAARSRQAEVRACVLSHRLSSDGFHLTSPDPSGATMSRAIRRALADAGLKPEEVGCITVTAAGSPIYDSMLSLAVEDALGTASRRVPVTTWEPAVGHALAATGVLALAHACWLLDAGSVHPVFDVNEVDPSSTLSYVLEQPVPLATPVVLTLIVGFGGQNGVCVLASPEVASDLEPNR